VRETGAGCLFGPNGSKDRNERKAGMPEGVFGVFEDGEGDDATEISGLLLLLVDERRTEGIAEGKALRLGCPGMDGDCCVAMTAKE
jgi:hypothetical protein